MISASVVLLYLDVPLHVAEGNCSCSVVRRRIVRRTRRISACLEPLAMAEPVMNDSNQSSSYEPRSEVRKREISSDISSKEMESAPKKKRVTKSFELCDGRGYDYCKPIK